MNTAPNFVEKVLTSGHLSTAEHASLMLPAGAFHGAKIEMFESNRFFDFPRGFVAGNMRSWLEYLQTSEYRPIFEYIVAIFPDVFQSTAHVDPVQLYEFSEQAAVHVPAYEGEFNVYLLSVNLGELAVSRRAGTVLHDPWVRYTWLLEGVSRSLTHQLVRHRGASFSQESQRYVDFEKGQAGKFYEPFVYPEGASIDQLATLETMYWNIARDYDALRKSGLRKEDARFVLPNAASTRLVCSFNTKELLHFLRIRCEKDAQWEIRRMAVQMARQAFLATPIKELEEIILKFGIEV